MALFLHADTRFEVMVANPRAVKNFAQALLERSKCDPLDARVLAEYAARMPFQAWQPPSPAALSVTALTRRLHALTESATREKNRLHALSATATTFRPALRQARWVANIFLEKSATITLRTC